ncbi:MAG: LysM peptidoglycan-binding domain-containing protein [Phycisphaerales bacterium]|nr:LysM peptidoglycan-binding domain-containing protein [Phycisphaerales bacterium]
MSSVPTRYGVLAALLAVIWIGVYWWTSPLSHEGPTIQRQVPDTTESVTPPQPVIEEPVVVVSPPEQQGPDLPESRGVVPPRFHDYVVRSGDDANRISERFYGTSRHWKAIMRANPNVSFDRLRAGRTIRVPVDPENVQGLPASDDPPPTPEPDPVITYTVRSGDTLSGIASTVYGRSALWTLIRDANPDLIRRRDGTDIRPGMELVIPPAPNSE